VRARLVLSGGFWGEEGLYEAEVKEVKLLESLDELSDGGPAFVAVPYERLSETLGVKVKSERLPVLRLALGGYEPLTLKTGKAALEPEGVSLTGEAFLERIGRVKGFIERGEVYQLNLTNRFYFTLKGSPLELFFSYYGRQPVPYAFFLELDGLLLVSGSMELFLGKRGKRVFSKPLKGTAARPEELLRSEKERAENLMITDMMRNDLSRACRRVRAEELFKLERYRTLWQMYSLVSGETEAGLKELLKATFPPASVTGAPKKRAVEIIDELEPHARGYYCGTAGLVLDPERFTLSVLIRTAYGRGERLSYFAGCGIVWDSVPERELEELRLKLKAFYPEAERLI